MRVLIAGSKRDVARPLHSAFDQAAFQLGELFSRVAENLIVESDDPITADYHFVKGALNTHSNGVVVEVHRLSSHGRGFDGRRESNLIFVPYPDSIPNRDVRHRARIGAIARIGVRVTADRKPQKYIDFFVYPGILVSYTWAKRFGVPVPHLFSCGGSGYEATPLRDLPAWVPDRDSAIAFGTCRA